VRYGSLINRKQRWAVACLQPVNLVGKRGLCGDEAQERGWIKEIIMDSAKDSGREMLAAINVEGSGFWLLFLFLSQ
jgi:hypothetical protein